MVTNLWELRDMWEWFWPGYRKNKVEALSRGGIVYYEKIAGWHDFELRRDLTDVDNPQVGLWAKKYMSSPTYEYIGTLTTYSMYKQFIRGLPAVGERAAQRQEGANIQLRKLEKLSTGQFKDHYTPERLADAIAVLKEAWGHGAESSGACPRDRLTVPPQLAGASR